MLDIDHRQVRYYSCFARKIIQTDIHAFEYVQPDREKYGAIFSFAPAGKMPEYFIEKLEGLSLIDTSFAPKDSSRPVIFVSPCHPFQLVMGVTI